MLIPIVRYAHLIGKNTAEFTTKDMSEYTAWWIRQPEGQSIMEGTAAQRKQYEDDVKEMQSWRESEEERKMSKKSNVRKFQDAQTSRLSAQLIDELVGESEIMDHENVPNGVDHTEIVCDMGLTQTDVEALLFSITRTFEDYDVEATPMYAKSLTQLKEGLEGI